MRFFALHSGDATPQVHAHFICIHELYDDLIHQNAKKMGLFLYKKMIKNRLSSQRATFRRMFFNQKII